MLVMVDFHFRCGKFDSNDERLEWEAFFRTKEDAEAFCLCQEGDFVLSEKTSLLGTRVLRGKSFVGAGTIYWWQRGKVFGFDGRDILDPEEIEEEVMGFVTYLP